MKTLLHISILSAFLLVPMGVQAAYSAVDGWPADNSLGDGWPLWVGRLSKQQQKMQPYTSYPPRTVSTGSTKMTKKSLSGKSITILDKDGWPADHNLGDGWPLWIGRSPKQMQQMIDARTANKREMIKGIPMTKVWR